MPSIRQRNRWVIQRLVDASPDPLPLSCQKRRLHVDPDSMVSVDPYPDPDSRSGSRRAKIAPKNRKKVNKFKFLKYWMFSFEG
jgi:hypothetical protein